MSEIHSRLGRGLGSMVNEVSGIRAGSAPAGGGYLRLPFNEIREPAGGREADAALIESVRKYGVLQPVLVARAEHQYELLAGSRRVRAARAAGLADVPALIIPADRAGSLDVFLEENLMRTELSADDREKLRDRWVRETGRDIAQASERIPAARVDESFSYAPAKPARNWQIATALLSALCAALMLIVFNTKPVDQRPVIIPVEFVRQSDSAVGPQDNRWMQAFAFPGSQRQVDGSTLEVTFGDVLFSETGLNARGQLILNQLAALVGTADAKLRIELLAPDAEGKAATEHLVGEGLAREAIAVNSASAGTLFKIRLARR